MNEDQLEFLKQFVRYLHTGVTLDSPRMNHGLELLEMYLDAGSKLFRYAHDMSRLMNGEHGG